MDYRTEKYQFNNHWKFSIRSENHVVSVFVNYWYVRERNRNV